MIRSIYDDGYRILCSFFSFSFLNITNAWSFQGYRHAACDRVRFFTLGLVNRSLWKPARSVFQRNNCKFFFDTDRPLKLFLDLRLYEGGPLNLIFENDEIKNSETVGIRESCRYCNLCERLVQDLLDSLVHWILNLKALWSVIFGSVV